MFLSLAAYLRPDIVALVLTLKTTGVCPRHGWWRAPARRQAVGLIPVTTGIYKRDGRLMRKCLPVSNDVFPWSGFRPDTVLMDE